MSEKSADDPSVDALCRRYFAAIGQPFEKLPAWYFSDNESEANELLKLVLVGTKRATSPSLWWFELHGEPMVNVGTLEVVTDWSGRARCIIRTKAVDVVAFDQVSAEYARVEGEGDRSLDYWRRVHWAYYQRELEGSRFQPSTDMPIVCIQFDRVF